MIAFTALLAMAILTAVVWVGAGPAGLDGVFAIVVPYVAIVVFLVGITARVLRWARAPVPYRITTACGQARSLPFIKHQKLESPFTTLGVVGRMALEVLAFRSLFRNTRTALHPGERVVYQSDKLLWLFALLFHWSFLVIFIRHLRFFLEPTPAIVTFIEHWDGFFQLAVPTLFVTDVLIVVGLLFLLGRRFWNPQVRYISLPADYFPLFLLLGVAVTGILMRYFTKVDLVAIKELSLGLVTFRPVVPEGLGTVFYVHLFFVCVLFAYFPFSKLVHLGGVFLSPTRNMANDNRARRHVNPDNPEVEVHTYDEWEDEFRDKLEAAGYALGRGE